MIRRVLWISVALASVWGLDQLARGVVNPYIYRVAVLCGINIVLALSLNLVNGITGQFSIGHAGFMAVGAYTATKITMAVHGTQLFGLSPAASSQCRPQRSP